MANFTEMAVRSLDEAPARRGLWDIMKPAEP